MNKILFKAVAMSDRAHQFITVGGQILFGMDGDLDCGEGQGVYVVGVEKAGKEFNNNQKMAIDLMLPSLKQAFPDATVDMPSAPAPSVPDKAAEVAVAPPKEKPDAKQA